MTREIPSRLELEMTDFGTLWGIPVSQSQPELPPLQTPTTSENSDDAHYVEFLRFPETPQRATWIFGQPLWRFDEAA
jgi:hypothetical protein